MTKQKRYTSEDQITASIDRAHQLEAKDLMELDAHHKEIIRLRPFEDQIRSVNYHKGQVELLDKRIKGSGSRLVAMKAKLAEFRTLTFPGMAEMMGDGSIAR